MKKFILLICILSWSYNTNAQCDNTLPISENFNDKTAVEFCWDFIDSDGDGRNWYVSNLGGNNGLISESFRDDTGVLYPNNWAITQVIDLRSYSTSSSIKVEWKVKVTDWSFDQERYSIYASTSNNPSTIALSPVTFFENMDGTGGNWVTRSLDISSLAGNMVYIAFRHFASVYQDAIVLDDIKISAGSISSCTDNDNDGVCDSDDLCPNTPLNAIVDATGCEITGGCQESTVNFNQNPLTHSGNGSETTTLTLPSGCQDISFTISGIDEKTKGKSSNYYIERVIVTYKDGSGVTKTNGTYRGDQLSSATINIPSNSQSITVSLDDAYDGNAGSTMSVNLSSVTYCGTQEVPVPPCTDSDGDGVCDADDQCPGTPANTTVDASGCPITGGCQESTTNFTGDALSGSNSTTLTLPANSQNVFFTISGLSEKLRGKSSTQYIEMVEVLYDAGTGLGYQSFGTFSGTDQSTASINILGAVKYIKVILTDQLGNNGSNLSVNFSAVTYCISNSSQARIGTSITSSKLNNEPAKEAAFKVYPNPASNKLFVKSTGLNDSKTKITLYNMNGIQVRSYDYINSKYSATTSELDLSGLSTGLYLLHIVNASEGILKTEHIVIK